MQKEFTITLNFNDQQTEMLENIRWQHIDIDTLIQEELNIILPPVIEDIINLYNRGKGK